MKLRIALLVMTALVPAQALANYCAAPLSRTNETIGSGAGKSIVNTYYPVTADIQAGNTIRIGGAFGANEDLRVGDIVLLWIPQTMQYTAASSNFHLPASFGDGVNGQGWTNLNHSGKFQWLRVAGTGGATGQLGDLVKAAGSGGTTDVTISDGGGQGTFGQLQISSIQSNITTLRSAQLIRVPQYGNVTISGTLTALPYQNTTNSGNTGPLGVGGIVALDVAGAVNFSAGSKIDVSRLGFRGGAGQQFGGSSAFNPNLPTATRFYGYAGTRTSGGIKGEGAAGTPHRVYFQSAESPNLSYTGTGTVSSEGYGVTTTPLGYGRGAPGNAGGGATDQCPYSANASSANGTMCRIPTTLQGTITYAYNRLNTGGGGGGGYGNGGNGGDHDYDGTGPNTPSGGGLGGKGISSFSLFANDALLQPPLPAGNHQFAMMGGGGGAGSTNAAGLDDLQSSGAAGGGVVLVRAGRITGSGSVLADGEDAQTVTATDPADPTGNNAGQGNGGGGGGGGGWILLSARQASTPSLSLSAQGGRGGNANGCMGSGGGGGGGYIGLSTTVSGATTSVQGGSAGTTSCPAPLSTSLPDGSALDAAYDAVAASAAASGQPGATGTFAAGGLSVPSTLASAATAAESSSSVAPGPQCVPILSKEFSIDGGTTWLSSINALKDQVFKMRIRIENGNEDSFKSGNTLPQLYEDITFTDTYGANIVNATPPNVQQNGCNSASITATAGQGTLAVASGSISGLSTCTIMVDLKATATGTWTNTIPRETVTVTQLKQVVGSGNALVLKNYEDVSASVTVPRSVEATKTSMVVSDPTNGTSDPKRIPGAAIDYTIAIENPTALALDNNTMIMTDTLPTTTSLYVDNLSPLSAPFEFTANGTNLTCGFTSLSDTGDCVDFSTDGTDWTYVPTPSPGTGVDANVKFIRFRTTGSMAATSTFTVRYRVVVK